MIISIFLIIFGFICLTKGADFLIDGASNIAKKFNISEMIIGLTIVAIGTSLPELVITIDGSLKGYSDLSIGSVVGSCIMNILVVLGVSSFIAPIYIDKKTKISNYIFLFLSIITVWIFGNINMKITRIEGILLLLFFIAFILNLNFKNNLEKPEENKKINIGISIFLIIVGIIGLKIGGDLIIDNSLIIGKEYGISESVLGLTIMSIGSSLPELITSIVAMRKNESDLVIGNIMGSNIFNLLLVVGLSSWIRPIDFSNEYNLFFLFLFISSLVLILFEIIGKKNKITKANGIVLIMMFLIYIGKILYS